MSALIPFQFDGRQVRVVDIDGAPYFVGKDICDALGYADHTNAAKQHCRGVVKRHPIADSLGRMQETRVLPESDVLRLIMGSALPAAEMFERWVFEEVLPTIRRTGSYVSPAQQPLTIATDALRLAPLAVRAARALGLDQNAAAISANQMVIKLTGVNLLQDFGHTHLKAANQDTQYFTPSDIGARIGVSAKKLNIQLAAAGFQIKRGKAWELTDVGRTHARIFDTGKRHHDGVPVQQIKWASSVAGVLNVKREAL